ncbi:DedA family protein [Thalassospira sp.]|uniref:DedA family protein n=1 Tax=Thalassospira sp. TaxID=1912094 RepID=UPI0032EB4ED1
MDAILYWIEINATLVYVVLFGYCLLKSGALPLFAGVLVSSEVLLALPVIGATFLGGYLGDEIRFALARRYGEAMQRRWPRTKTWVARGNRLLEKYGTAYIFLYRYPKGMRTIGALPLGTGHMRWRVFTWLNAASAALWCAVLVGLGYVFGNVIIDAVEDGFGFVSVGLLIVFVAMGWFALRRMERLDAATSQ